MKTTTSVELSDLRPQPPAEVELKIPAPIVSEGSLVIKNVGEFKNLPELTQYLEQKEKSSDHEAFARVMTPLAEAAKNGQVKYMETLLIYAKKTLKKNLLHTVSHHAAMSAIEEDKAESLQVILKHVVDLEVNGDDHYSGIPYLIKARRYLAENCLLVLLQHPKVDINQCDNRKWGFNALMEAADIGDLPSLHILLQDPRTRVNLKESLGWNALRLAVYNDHVDCVAELLEHKDIEVDEGILRLTKSFACFKLILKFPGITLDSELVARKFCRHRRQQFPAKENTRQQLGQLANILTPLHRYTSSLFSITRTFQRPATKFTTLLRGNLIELIAADISQKSSMTATILADINNEKKMAQTGGGGYLESLTRAEENLLEFIDPPSPRKAGLFQSSVPVPTLNIILKPLREYHPESPVHDLAAKNFIRELTLSLVNLKYAAPAESKAAVNIKARILSEKESDSNTAAYRTALGITAALFEQAFPSVVAEDKHLSSHSPAPAPSLPAF